VTTSQEVGVGQAPVFAIITRALVAVRKEAAPPIVVTRLTSLEESASTQSVVGAATD